MAQTMDPSACRIDIHGMKVAFGNRIYELKQDCDWADVMISDARLPRTLCPNRSVRQFGYYDFKNNGAMSLLGGNHIQVNQVGDDRGIRPWTQKITPYKSTTDKGS